MLQKRNKTTQPIRSDSDREALSGYFMRNSLRNYAFFKFGIFTGRRISDIVKLNVSDVAYIDRHSKFRIVDRLMINEKKTNKNIDIILHPSARSALSKYLRSRLKNARSMGALLLEPLFISQKPRRDGSRRITKEYAWDILNKAARACFLNYKIGTHSLRKTFGYMLYQKDTSIAHIQKLLSHSSPEVTLAYIGITRDDLDDAILAL